MFGLNVNWIQIGALQMAAGALLAGMVTMAACIGIFKIIRRKLIFRFKWRPPPLKERFRFTTSD